jgi:phosphatidylglycerol:prolipoprotein diacylglycerol transferase
MLYFYQHLSQHINPIAFSIGSFSVRWYSLMYLAGFIVVYYLLLYRARRDNHLSKIFNFQFSIFNNPPAGGLNSKLENSKLIQNSKFKIQNSTVIDFLMYAFIGLIAGARLGYVLFYNLNYFISSPLAIISPFDSSGNFVGIFGMSYFGGLIGIVIATIIFCRKNKIDFWQWADFAVPAIPAGYFFGRIGNFLNGELFGKATDHFWGMYFGDGILRHPTQLYEAALEGLLLFLILWYLRNKSKFPGYLLAIYLFGYGIIRFFIEFLREPEGVPIFGLTMGQILSLAIVVISAIFFLHKIKKLWYNSPNA